MVDCAEAAPRKLIPEIQTLLDALLKAQERLAVRFKLERARVGDGWNRNLWVLPLCPPTNSLYPGKVRRHKGKHYKAWEQEAEAYWLYQLVRKREVGNVTGLHPTASFPRGPRHKWTLEVYSFMPTYRDGDLDGRLKALIDFLCRATGHDDRYLMGLQSLRITNGERLRGQVVIFGGP
jgi:hypothetical protein